MFEESERAVPDDGLCARESRDESRRRCAGRYRGPSVGRNLGDGAERFGLQERRGNDVVDRQTELDIMLRRLGESARARGRACPLRPATCRLAMPRALRNVYAIAPPIRIASTLVKQIANDADLVGDFCAAEDRDGRMRRIFGDRAQRVELAHHQEAGRALGDEARDARPSTRARDARCRRRR